ncbi:MAG: hypothetical protein WD512_14765 [Candidatus Paceibacterota bacterium]
MLSEIILHKLVREKVEYYLNYQIWCDKRKKMNQEYHLKVKIQGYDDGGRSIKLLCYIDGIKPGASAICTIKDDQYYARFGTDIYQWVKRYYYDNIIIPQKYWYTSGMRSKRGYNKMPFIN